MFRYNTKLIIKTLTIINNPVRYIQRSFAKKPVINSINIVGLVVSMAVVIILSVLLPIHWGNLSNNRYDPKRHINSFFVRPAVLNNNIKLEYLSFIYPDNLTNKKSYFDNLFQIKVSLDKIIDLLELRNPHYTIRSFIYKDIEQKTQLCCHDGYGNAYPEWKEINVVFNENNNVLIHESIHILFDNEMNNIDNSCLLGELYTYQKS